MIFDEVFSKEPLAPAVVDGDSRWAQAVEWAIFATIQAEEFGITSANVDGFDAGTDPSVVHASSAEAETDDGTRRSIRARPAGRLRACRSSPRSATTARSSTPT